MSANAKIVIILQCINISNEHMYILNIHNVIHPFISHEWKKRKADFQTYSFQCIKDKYSEVWAS